MGKVQDPHVEHLTEFQDAFTLLQEARRAIAWTFPLLYFQKQTGKKQMLSLKQYQMVDILAEITK